MRYVFELSLIQLVLAWCIHGCNGESFGNVSSPHENVRGVVAHHIIERAAPTFLVPTATTAPRSVDENSAKDVSILTVEGQDGDGDTLTYSISTQSPVSPAFEFDSFTGLLRTPDGLDAETTKSFVFTFGASDGTTTVDSDPFTVYISDLNDNAPKFVQTTYSATLLDTASNGTIVANVRATDADVTQGFITYNIVAGNTGNTFAIDSHSGHITLSTNAYLNVAITPCYMLTVQASDGLYTDTANVIVTVKHKSGKKRFLVGTCSQVATRETATLKFKIVQE